jgi:hypothetical protein
VAKSSIDIPISSKYIDIDVMHQSTKKKEGYQLMFITNYRIYNLVTNKGKTVNFQWTKNSTKY